MHTQNHTYQSPTTQEIGSTNPRSFRGTSLHSGVELFMAKTFAWMSASLGVSAGTAGLVAASPEAMNFLFNSHLLWLVLLIPLLMVVFFAHNVSKVSPAKAALGLGAIALTYGVILAPIFHVYSLGSIVGVLLVTMVTFAGLSLFGFVTRIDMSPIGNFLFMALFGVIVTSIVSILFIPTLNLWVSGVAVLIYAGLVAYDTQQLKQEYLSFGSNGNLALSGALHLYLDFLGIFLHLLRFTKE